MTKWKLVPVDEITPEMDNAARDWSVSKYGRGIGNDAAHGCYSAMLEAAPQTPKLSDERIAELYQAAFGMPINDEYGPTEVHDFARAVEREILGGGDD